VFISIWETRNADYEVFVKATGRSWRQPYRFPRTEDMKYHPAVMVSWRDAMAFCEWLTAKERADGAIGTNACYRLPKDKEWSAAIGMRHVEGRSPGERMLNAGPALPWGESWPPPNGIGNLSPRLAVDDWRWTAPVGSFSPNKRGIYDLVGNVEEWCEEVFGPSSEELRATRGSSFASSKRPECAASICTPWLPGDVQDNIGFRCIFSEYCNTNGAASGPAAARPRQIN